MVEACLAPACSMGIVKVLALMIPAPASRCFPPPTGVVGKTGRWRCPQNPETGICGKRETFEVSYPGDW